VKLTSRDLIGMAFKLSPTNIQSNWAHLTLFLSLSAYTTLLNFLLTAPPAPSPPVPPDPIYCKLDIEEANKARKNKSTHIGIIIKIVGKLQRSLLVNQI
jgi:hypothetical protein